MKQLSFLTVCLFTFFVSQAQSDSKKPEKKQKSFIVSIKTLDNKTIKGRLYAINDSQLVVAKSVKKLSHLLPANEQQYIPAENIKSFSLIKKNSILKGALIGAGIGAAIGIALSLEPGQYYVTDAAAVTGFGVYGAIVGTIIGALSKKKFIIGGNKERFRSLQPEISMKLSQK